MTTPRSVLHLVTTGNFAGAERYVTNVAATTAELGVRVTVIGGDPARMTAELPTDVTWLPGASLIQAIRSVRRAGMHEICHVHMTMAEAIGIATRRIHCGRVVATRHFAAARGSSVAGRMLARWIDRRLDRQIAISRYVDARLERPADDVLLNGTPTGDRLWSAESRRILVLQRLEPEKHTALAIDAWYLSGLAEQGWTLRIVGDGSQAVKLRERVEILGVGGVEFAGHVQDVRTEFAAAGLLLATAPAEPLGLSVVEAMAVGVPVVAAASGGHLETIRQVPEARLFPADDPGIAAEILVETASSHSSRDRVSQAIQDHHRRELSIARHCERLLATYLGESGAAPEDVGSWPIAMNHRAIHCRKVLG